MDVAAFDPELDLVIEHVIDITPEQAWDGWTMPEHLVHWFTPAPWVTTLAEVDLRPGGEFHTIMQGPEGDTNEGRGCYLAVEPHGRLIWTSAVGPGLRPNAPVEGGFLFTVVLTFEPAGNGTRYNARVMHATPADKNLHESMGFVDGWTAAMRQLVDRMTSIA